MKTKDRKKWDLSTACHYDQIKKMNQDQLELALLACIYHEPIREKQKGLFGLDQSMFQNKILFDIFFTLMRTEFSDPSKLPDDVMAVLMENELLSTLEQMRDEMFCLPALYRHYANEIERRASIDYSSGF